MASSTFQATGAAIEGAPAALPDLVPVVIADLPPLVRALAARQPAAIFLLDEQARVVGGNCAARQLAATSTRLRAGLQRHSGAGLADVVGALQGTHVASPTRSTTTFAIEDSCSSQPLHCTLVHVDADPAGCSSPEPVHAVLMVRDPAGRRTLNTGYLREIYGLTGAECEVAQAILNGTLPSGIAAGRGVSMHTVRKQLKSIFEKTGTVGQVELVRVLMALSD